MDNIYLIKFSTTDTPHLIVRECEILEDFTYSYEVETGSSIEYVQKSCIDDIEHNIYMHLDNDDRSYIAYTWVTENTEENVAKFKAGLIKSWNNKIARLEKELIEVENRKVMLNM